MKPDTTENNGGDAAHVEGVDNGTGSRSPAVDTSGHLKLSDDAVNLNNDELRDQMTAQIKATKLSFTSKTAFQLYFYLFIAYCSKSTRTTKPLQQTLMKDHRFLGHGFR